jgi:hypothetical protein
MQIIPEFSALARGRCVYARCGGFGIFHRYRNGIAMERPRQIGERISRAI